MGIRNWFRSRRRAGRTREASREDTSHLHEWATARSGVEAYVEPRTAVTQTTVMLIAHDGEWTRRRVSGPPAARSLGKTLGIPVYDANKVGYPTRLRAYNARRSKERRAKERRSH